MLIGLRLEVDYTLSRLSISEKRPRSCDTGVRYCDALCAAMMTQFLYILSCSFRLSIAAVGRNRARANCARCCAGKHGLFVQQWCCWAMNVHGYRSSGAAPCCGLIHRHRCGHPPPNGVTYGLVVAVPCARNGAGRLARCHSFESQNVWSVLHRRGYSAAHGCASDARGCRYCGCCLIGGGGYDNLACYASRSAY